MGTRAVRRFAITLVVLVVLLVAADRIGLYVAERTAGDTIQSSQHLSARPDVDIAGFPFLTQLARAKFGTVTVTAHDLPVGESGHVLDVTQIRVVLHTVTVSRDFATVRADSADATATVGYAALGKTLGLDVGYAGDGRVRASKDIALAGHTVHGSVAAEPVLTDGALSFAKIAIDGAGAIGAAVTSALGDVFRLDIPLDGIPFHIRVTDLHADAQGIRIAFVGRDLVYSG